MTSRPDPSTQSSTPDRSDTVSPSGQKRSAQARDTDTALHASGTAGAHGKRPDPRADEDLDDAGRARRRALSCMAWAGAGMLWTVSGGVPTSMLIDSARAAELDQNAFTFVQISDSHIGFSKEPNLDPASTLQQAIDVIKLSPQRPAFMIHTGDISHLSKPGELDTAQQIIRGTGLDVHYVPGEHDVLVDDGQSYLDRFSPNNPKGWYSFDQNGVHFIGLVNVMNLKAGGLGLLGDEQLDWLRRDLEARTSSTPIVVFAHIPLWTVYPEWGWGTDDGARALGYLRRFGSVTVLNGHIHQVAQKVEGSMSFYTAMSTAFPQPAPGSAPNPGPMKVPADQLKSMLGLRAINFIPGHAQLAVVDTKLNNA